MQKTVYLSLGSNTGEREAELQKAIDLLAASDFQIQRISSVYETAPVDYKDQPHFLNCVVEARTTAFPIRLLQRIGAIETEMGRKRTTPKGPRNIDIDILLFGRFVVDTPKLVIPHAHMTERRFMMEPLVELTPDLRHPVTRQTMKELLAAAPHQFVRRTALRLTLPGTGPSPEEGS
jgi:2-amino-4-hydroxy-6-hydroxymethyldihydropteridine diphosphokinase